MENQNKTYTKEELIENIKNEIVQRYENTKTIEDLITKVGNITSKETKQVEKVNELCKRIEELEKKQETVKDTITEDLTTNTVDNKFLYENIEAVKNANLKVGDVVETLGYYVAYDGGTARYKIIEAETLVAEGGFMHKLANGLVAQLLMPNDTDCNVKQFGAKGNNEDDDINAIQLAVDFVQGLPNGGTVYFPQGNYKITKEIRIKKSNVTLQGLKGNKIYYHGLGWREQVINVDSGFRKNSEGCIYNTRILNLHLDGTYQENKGGATLEDLKHASPNPYYTRGGLCGIRATRCSNIKIEGNVLNDIFGNGIAIDRSSFVDVNENYLSDCAGSGFGGGNNGDTFGDGVGAWKCFSVTARRNIIINKRVFEVHENHSGDCYGKPCARSGLEFEYTLNIDFWGNSECWTPYADLTESTVEGYDLVFEDNYVYGYNKGCHLEYGVNCLINGNTFIHNCIGVLDATGGNTIITNNEFNADYVGHSPQGGYDWYYADVAFTHFLGIEHANAVVDGNMFGGDAHGIILCRNYIDIKNNTFRKRKYNDNHLACIWKKADWLHHFNIVGNQFFNVDDENPISSFIDLTGNDMNISGNLFISRKSFVSNLLNAGSVNFSNNVLLNSNVQGTNVTGNVFCCNIEKRISFNAKNITNNIFHFTAGTLNFIWNCRKIVNNEFYLYNQSEAPSVGVWIFDNVTHLLQKYDISDNYIDVTMKDGSLIKSFIILDGRNPKNSIIDLQVKNNYFKSFSKDFTLVRPYSGKAEYTNLRVEIDGNYPNRMVLNTPVNAVTGNYYNVGDTIKRYDKENTSLVCTKEGFYCNLPWTSKVYKEAEFCLNDGKVYRCISNVDKFTSITAPTKKNSKFDIVEVENVENSETKEVETKNHTITWGCFGEVAEFKTVNN